MRPRDSLVLEFWDRSGKLKTTNKWYGDFVLSLMNLLLKNDIKGTDITTGPLIKNKSIAAFIIAKENGIIAGLEEFALLNKDLKLKFRKKDGDKVKNDEIVVEIRGNAGRILERERINLNLLQRMSGIATTVDSISNKIKKNVKIAATRKTLWGVLDKKAVSVGGGFTHRLGLNDGILVKENHLKIIGYDFEEALHSVKDKSKYIEIEVEDKSQALKASIAIKKTIKRNNKNIYAIMLDKIPPNEIKSVIKNLENQNLYNYVLLEASGNINEGNIRQYSDCGADVISMGSITNSAKVLNMSLEIK